MASAVTRVRSLCQPRTPGPVGLVDPLRDHPFDPGRAVPEHPAAGDGGVGGGGGEHEPVGQAAGEELLQLAAPLLVGTVAPVAAVVGEEVEHDERRRCRGCQTADPGATGAEPVLQGGEVEPAGPPHHQLTVEDHVVELGHRGGDVGEACGEVAELAGLQVHAAMVAEGQRAEAIVLWLERPAGTDRELCDGLRRHRLQWRAKRGVHRRTVGTSRRADRQRTERSLDGVHLRSGRRRLPIWGTVVVARRPVAEPRLVRDLMRPRSAPHPVTRCRGASRCRPDRRDAVSERLVPPRAGRGTSAVP